MMNAIETTDILWSRNPVVGGIEIEAAPNLAELCVEDLKQAGWRWSESNQSWYNRDTPQNEEFAQRFCDRLAHRKPR